MTDDLAPYVAHDIPDLLNALPTLFGFRPHESLVAVATYGARRRCGFRLRLDLPDASEVDRAAELVRHHLLAQGADGAIVVALTERQTVARELLAAVESGLDPVEPIVVTRATDTRFWVDVPGFPADGIPYELSDHHEAVVQAIARGQNIVADRSVVEQRFAAVSGPLRDAMIAECAEALGPVLESMDDDSTGLRARALIALDPTIRSIQAGETLTHSQIAQLCVWAASIDVRDELWENIRPETAERWLAALTRASQLVVPPYEPAILALASFAAWAVGDGVQALIAAERARDAAPGYAMAHLMLQIVEQGLSPQVWRQANQLPEVG